MLKSEDSLGKQVKLEDDLVHGVCQLGGNLLVRKGFAGWLNDGFFLNRLFFWGSGCFYQNCPVFGHFSGSWYLLKVRGHSLLVGHVQLDAFKNLSSRNAKVRFPELDYSVFATCCEEVAKC